MGQYVRGEAIYAKMGECKKRHPVDLLGYIDIELVPGAEMPIDEPSTCKFQFAVEICQCGKLKAKEEKAFVEQIAIIKTATRESVLTVEIDNVQGMLEKFNLDDMDKSAKQDFVGKLSAANVKLKTAIEKSKVEADFDKKLLANAEKLLKEAVQQEAKIGRSIAYS